MYLPTLQGASLGMGANSLMLNTATSTNGLHLYGEDSHLGHFGAYFDLFGIRALQNLPAINLGILGALPLHQPHCSTPHKDPGHPHTPCHLFQP